MSSASATATLPARVFISHAGDDAAVADALAASLRRGGLELADRVDDAQLSCVLWSPASARSAQVLEECARAKARGGLLPIRLDDTDLPVGLGTLQPLSLDALDSEHHLEVIRDEIRRAMRSSHLWATAAPLDTSSQTRASRRGLHKIVARQRRLRLFWSAVGVTALLAVGLWGVGSLYRSHAARDLVGESLRLILAAEPLPLMAQARLEEALQLDPTHGPALYHAAQLHVQAGDWARAREQLQTLARFPGGLDPAQVETAQQLLQRLDGGNPEPTAPPPDLGHHTDQAHAAAWPVPAAERFLAALSPASHPPAATGEAEGHARALFDIHPPQRLHALAMLQASPHLLSDALPTVLKRALALTESGREIDATATHAMHSALDLAMRASPLSLVSQKKTLTILLDRLKRQNWGGTIAAQAQQVRNRLTPSIPAPRVQLLWEPGSADVLAQRTVQHLQSLGWEVTAMPLHDVHSPGRTLVRTLGAAHAETARWLRRQVDTLTHDESVRLEYARDGHGTRDDFVVWLARDLCHETPPSLACQPPSP